jgi:hypothetical protein
MIGVALVELLPDAQRDAHWALAAAVAFSASIAQVAVHLALKDE